MKLTKTKCDGTKLKLQVPDVGAVNDAQLAVLLERGVVSLAASCREALGASYAEDSTVDFKTLWDQYELSGKKVPTEDIDEAADYLRSKGVAIEDRPPARSKNGNSVSAKDWAAAKVLPEAIATALTAAAKGKEGCPVKEVATLLDFTTFRSWQVEEMKRQAESSFGL